MFLASKIKSKIVIDFLKYRHIHQLCASWSLQLKTSTEDTGTLPRHIFIFKVLLRVVILGVFQIAIIEYHLHCYLDLFASISQLIV